MTDERRQDERGPIGLRIRLRFLDLPSFVAGYGANLSRAGVFLEGVSPRPVDTVVRFEILLVDGTTALRGEGRVVAAREGEGGGIAVKFTKLDARSKALVDEVAAARDERSARDANGAASPGGALGDGHATPRAAREKLERALEALAEQTPGLGRASSPRLSRPSLLEIDGELERLSGEVLEVRASRLPPLREATVAVVTTAPLPSLLPPEAAAPGVGEAQPVDDDSGARLAAVPPPPAAEPARAPSDVAAAPVADEPSGQALAAAAPSLEPAHDAPQGGGEDLAAIPQPPGMPGPDVGASVGLEPDLPNLELGDLLESFSEGSDPDEVTLMTSAALLDEARSGGKSG